jgi:hypothetical protein
VQAAHYLKVRHQVGDLGVSGRIILKVILRKYGCGMDSCGSGYRPVAGCCEHGNELKRLEQLNDCQLLKDYSVEQ